MVAESFCDCWPLFTVEIPKWRDQRRWSALEEACTGSFRLLVVADPGRAALGPRRRWRRPEVGSGHASGEGVGTGSAGLDRRHSVRYWADLFAMSGMGLALVAESVSQREGVLSTRWERQELMLAAEVRLGSGRVEAAVVREAELEAWCAIRQLCSYQTILASIAYQPLSDPLSYIGPFQEFIYSLCQQQDRSV